MKHSIREAQRIIQECCDPRPFETGVAGDVGVLLIHGFTASPTETRPLAEYIGKHATWHCKGILLPGHGQKVEALENATADEWVQTAVNGYLDLATRCRRIFLAGVSMGAVICCQLALRFAREGKIRGVILLSPSFGLTTRQIVGVKLLKGFMRFKNKSVATANSYVERNLYSYTRVPLRKVEEMLQLGTDAFNRLSDLKSMPILMLAGTQDVTVSVDRIREAAARNPWIQFREFSKSKHVLTVEPDKQEVFTECLKFMQQQVQ